jgi:hypothetical protein
LRWESEVTTRCEFNESVAVKMLCTSGLVGILLGK